jgi:hypothetical protein
MRYRCGAPHLDPCGLSPWAPTGGNRSPTTRKISICMLYVTSFLRARYYRKGRANVGEPVGPELIACPSLHSDAVPRMRNLAAPNPEPT